MSNNRSMFSISDDIKSRTATMATPTAQPQVDAIALLLNDPAHSHLKELHLGAERFNETTVQQVSQALAKNKTLTTLELEGDKNNKPNPVSFSSNHSRAHSETHPKKKEKVILESIFRALRDNHTLKKLHIANADLNHEDTIHQLNMMLKENHTLETLILDNCSLAGKVSDLTCIKENSGLRILELPDNNLSTHDLELLASRMKSKISSGKPGNQHLIKINLDDHDHRQHSDQSKRDKLMKSIETAIKGNRIKYLKTIQDIPHYNRPEPTTQSNQNPGYTFARLLGGTIGSLTGGAISAGVIALTIGFGGLIAAGPIGWAILGGIAAISAVCGALMGDVIVEHGAAVREQAQQTKQVVNAESSGVAIQRRLHEYHGDIARLATPSKEAVDVWKAKYKHENPETNYGAGVFYSSESESENSIEDRTGADILISDSDSEESVKDMPSNVF